MPVLFEKLPFIEMNGNSLYAATYNGKELGRKGKIAFL